jgi:hypothetical protein
MTLASTHVEKPADRFVSDHCFNCKDSLVIAEQIKQNYPDVHVKIFNIDNGDRHDVDIFAVPTYAFNGKVVFLGNPTETQIEALLGRQRTASASS